MLLEKIFDCFEPYLSPGVEILFPLCRLPLFLLNILGHGGRAFSALMWSPIKNSSLYSDILDEYPPISGFRKVCSGHYWNDVACIGGLSIGGLYINIIFIYCFLKLRAFSILSPYLLLCVNCMYFVRRRRVHALPIDCCYCVYFECGAWDYGMGPRAQCCGDVHCYNHCSPFPQVKTYTYDDAWPRSYISFCDCYFL